MIPSKPTRVVAVGVSDADIALALGVTPVGIHSLYDFDSGVGPWAVSKIGTPAPTVWKGRELNFEGIAAVRPDLILDVTAGGDKDEYDRLSKIAPTVALPKGVPAYSAPWPVATTLIAKSLGLSAEGDALVKQTQDYLAKVAADNPGFKGKTLTYLDVSGTELYAGGRESTVVSTMTQLGFVPVPYIQNLQPSESQNLISAELLTQVDANVLLAYGFGASDADVLAANPALANLPSVKAGHARFLPDLSLSAPSVLSIPYGVDALVPFLKTATG